MLANLSVDEFLVESGCLAVDLALEAAERFFFLKSLSGENFSSKKNSIDSISALLVESRREERQKANL